MRSRIFTTQPLSWKCCAKCGTEERLDRHHILPRSDGGTDSPGNLAWLCKSCHKLWHSLRRSKALKTYERAAAIFGTWLRQVPPVRRGWSLSVTSAALKCSPKEDR